MVPFQMDNAKITAAVARVTKFHDRYVGETDEDLKLNYLEGLVKAAKALKDLVRIVLSGSLIALSFY